MKLSTDQFKFQTSLNSLELSSNLQEQTYSSRSLVMIRTSKTFIGSITKGEFKLISSWFPLGSACVVTGQLNNENGQLELITSLHIAFRALFIIWLLTMSVLFVIGHMSTNELTSWLTEVIGLLIGATLFRLFIHSAYARARNKFISQLSEILDLNKRDV